MTYCFEFLIWGKSEITCLNNFCLKKIYMNMVGNKCAHTLPLSVKAETDLTVFLKDSLVISIRRKTYILIS